MCTYPGDSDGKRLARLHIYETMQKLWLRCPSSKAAHALSLTGDAGEVGALRYLLKYEPQRVHLVDSNPQAAKYQTRWPRARWVTAKVEQYLGRTPAPFNFIHLDYTGWPKREEYRAVEAAGRCTVPGGFVVLAFHRGREHGEYRNVLRHDSNEPALSGLPAFDRSRFSAYHEQFANRLSRSGRFVRSFMLRYDSGSTPMGVIAYQHVPLTEETSELMFARKKTDYVRDIPDDKSTRRALRVKALDLKNQGRSYEQIEAILHVPKGTVTAWLAHQTRGTYDRE